MKILFCVLLVLILSLPSHQYYCEKPLISLQQEKTSFGAIMPGTTTIIKGLNGKNYEVTMMPSRPIFERHFPPQQIMTVQQLVPPVINSQLNSLHNENFPQSFDNQQQHLNFNTNQYNEKTTDNGAQNNYQLLAESSEQQQLQQQPQAQAPTSILSQQQQQQQLAEDSFFPNIPQIYQQQAGTFAQIIQQQVAKLAQGQQQQKQQQQYNQQQFEQNMQQLLPHNNLPNTNNLLNDLANNHIYVSQSEASQLDAYAYEQINGNPRPFTRTISKCDALGQCEPQSATAEVIGGSDFHHQQVLKQTKAQLEPTADKCQNKFNYKFKGNELTNDAAKAQKGIPIKKGTDLKARRLFLYNEAVMPQYPHN